MTAMTVMPREFRDWTVHDLEQIPDDGLQYELLDGILLVSPSPTRLHQRTTLAVYASLIGACPPELEVLVAPLDWQPDSQTSLQPDVLVLSNRELDADIGSSMILAVEVLSPSTRRKDVILKRSKYQDAGIRSYWIVDPAVPAILALELVDGRYVTVGEATGDVAITLEKPYVVTLVPSALIS